jgi:hypothetical protein
MAHRKTSQFIFCSGADVTLKDCNSASVSRTEKGSTGQGKKDHQPNERCACYFRGGRISSSRTEKPEILSHLAKEQTQGSTTSEQVNQTYDNVLTRNSKKAPSVVVIRNCMLSRPWPSMRREALEEVCNARNARLIWLKRYLLSELRHFISRKRGRRTCTRPVLNIQTFQEHERHNPSKQTHSQTNSDAQPAIIALT